MNPYPERIGELHEFLAARYGQRDRQATEILLACLLDPAITGVRKPWIVVETDFPSRETDTGWFSFGSTARTRSLAVPRVERLNKCEEILSGWLDERKADPNREGIFIDAEYRRGVVLRINPINRINPAGTWRAMTAALYDTLLASSIRLRVDHPRSGIALGYDNGADGEQLSTLTRRVLDNTFRERRVHAAEVPASFLYWCELLQRLAPLQTDWEALTGQIAAVARNVGILYHDGRAFGKEIAERLLRDAVPYGTRTILEESIEGDSRKGVAASRVVMSLSLAARNGPDAWARREVKRLIREGILKRKEELKRRTTGYLYHPWKYRVTSEDYRTLLDRGKELLV
jgi:hypothetical protein